MTEWKKHDAYARTADPATCRYNGVELPNINKVWTDELKERYPYATIILRKDFGGYNLLLSGSPSEKLGSFIVFDDVRQYNYASATQTWKHYRDSEFLQFYLGEAASDTSVGIWTNGDIIDDTSGSVYLAASDPVPVGGEPEEPEQPETRTEWIKQDAYKPNTEWNGKTFYRVMGGKWVKQDVVVPKVVEVEPDVPEPDVPEPDVPEPDIPDPEKPTSWLTFSSAEPFTIATTESTKCWNGTLYYSTDTDTWSEWSGTTAIQSAEHEGEQRIYMRGVQNTYVTKYKYSGVSPWILTGDSIACNGNIETLLDYEILLAGKRPTMGGECFNCLFHGCSSLVSAPELPATTLAVGCYASMFSDCTSLVSAPKLPATTLEWECYAHMFSGCTSLVNAPELPATTLAAKCYQYMFSDCKKLITAPELPATTLSPACYSLMFYGCTSLVIAPKLPATNLASECYMYMFSGCTALSSIPALPALEAFWPNCYSYMFRNCSNIKLSETQSDEYPNEYRIPTSGSGTWVSNSATDMFTGTGGTFAGKPSFNTTYYTANEVV